MRGLYVKVWEGGGVAQFIDLRFASSRKLAFHAQAWRCVGQRKKT